MNTSPPAVLIGPPRLIAPAPAGAPRPRLPSGTSQTLSPVVKSMASSVPYGGGVQGRPEGASSGRRRTA